MNEENKELEGVEEDQEGSMTLEELMSLAGDPEESQEILLPPVELNLNNVAGLSLDTSEFEKGVRRASEIAGFVTALKNVGLENSTILELIATEWGIDLNREIAEIQKETNIEIAKHNKKTEDDCKL